MTDRPEVVRWIAARGGIATIHVTPFTNTAREVIGWQNVIVCTNGDRRGLSPYEEDEIGEHGEYLRATKEAA